MSVYAPKVSVIVVSRGRSAALQRCLMGLEQLFFRPFEVIVVADAAGLQALDAVGLLQRVKPVSYEAPNISVARNKGIAEASGDFLAFIDDDAVPEPSWLDALVAPFADDGIASVGGYVRGRNGISFQSRGAWVDTTGLEAPELGAGRFETQPGRAIKTVGTNCAFRRQCLAQIGGFDPAFAFYLDETDVNMRLAEASHPAAIAPGAQVHHGFMASSYRTADRVPRTLYHIGASLGVFLRKHHAGPVAPVFAQMRVQQRRRIDRHYLAGNCTARDMARLMHTLECGFAAGQFRTLRALDPIAPATSRFKPFKPRQNFTASKVISGWSTQSHLREQAKAAVLRGTRVSLFLFSPTALYHRVAFEAGVWVQTGGIYGRSDRSHRLVQGFRKGTRLSHEIDRVSAERGLSERP